MFRSAIAALLVMASLAPAQAFEGRYRTSGGTMTIGPVASGKVTVKIEIGTNNCIGSISAKGQIRGDRIVASAADGGDVCHLDIRRRGRGLVVAENGDCNVFHGVSCEFGGNYTPR